MALNQPTRADLDAAARRAYADLQSALDNLGVLKSIVDQYDAARLMSASPGEGEATYAYTQADVDNLKAFVFQYTAILAATPIVEALTFGRRVAGLTFVSR